MQIRGVAPFLVALALALATAPLMLACDETNGPQEPNRFDAEVVDLGDGDGAGGAGGGSGEVEERLRLSYTKRVQPQAGMPAFVDMVVYDFEDDEEYNLTGGEGVVDCVTKICRLNDDMTWIGWLEADPAGGGFRLLVAPVDVVRKVVLTDQAREIDNAVNDFRFTTYSADPLDEASPEVELIIYSKGQAAEIDDRIDVRASPVAPLDEEVCAEGAGLPDCPALLGLINTNGGFRVTQLGSLIILIETTLSTMTLNFFNVMSGAQSTIYTFGEQMMTGSQFDGRQPIGFSPDASYLAVFTKDEQVWRLNALQARPSPPDPEVHALWEVDANNQGGDCLRAMPYNFTEVRFDPVFSRDSEWIYFLARGDCASRPTNENPTNRDDFDIMRINRRLEGQLENVTGNLRASHWSNHDIGDFDLSPDGSKLVFTAQRPNQANDRSIWLIDPETGEYDCSRGQPLPVIDGRERCEFIVDDRNGASVTLRDLNFHTVEVPVD